MMLPYDKSSFILPNLWDGIPTWLEPGPFPDVDGPKVVETALEEPIASPAISGLDLSRSNIVCVIPDLTRRAAVSVYLPILLSCLESAGADPKRIKVVVALGIHRPLGMSELKGLVGEKVWGRIKVINHDPHTEGELVMLGVTSGCISVEINRTVAEADMVILTGGITYHYFAGYGGGRKAFLPGVASRRSCEDHHKMVVSWRRGELDGDVAPGILKGNPVHEQMLQACSFAPSVYTLNVVTDPNGRIIGATYGDLTEAHLAACKTHDIYYRREINRASSLVLASAGGYPKDINLVQAHKGLYGSHMPVADGGVVILMAHCSEGAGYSDFFNWFDRCRSEEEWLLELDTNYHINAQTAFSTWLHARRNPTILLSGLNPSDVRKMGMIPVASVEEALREARTILGELPVPVVLPDAADTLTVVKGQKFRGVTT